jgi:hypothetical protein
MLLGIAIVFRYQYRAVRSTEPPGPERLDIAIGVANAIISWRLCKYQTAGSPRIARVGFQVMALVLLLSALTCYRTASPAWYHSLAKMHNAFVYTRWFILVWGGLRIFSGYHELYTISIFFGGMLGIWEGRYPWDGILGVPLGLVLHTGLVIFEKWTSSLITPESISPHFSNIIKSANKF